MFRKTSNHFSERDNIFFVIGIGKFNVKERENSYGKLTTHGWTKPDLSWNNCSNVRLSQLFSLPTLTLILTKFSNIYTWRSQKLLTLWHLIYCIVKYEKYTNLLFMERSTGRRNLLVISGDIIVISEFLALGANQPFSIYAIMFLVNFWLVFSV